MRCCLGLHQTKQKREYPINKRHPLLRLTIQIRKSIEFIWSEVHAMWDHRRWWCWWEMLMSKTMKSSEGSGRWWRFGHITLVYPVRWLGSVTETSKRKSTVMACVPQTPSNNVLRLLNFQPLSLSATSTDMKLWGCQRQNRCRDHCVSRRSQQTRIKSTQYASEYLCDDRAMSEDNSLLIESALLWFWGWSIWWGMPLLLEFVRVNILTNSCRRWQKTNS
jgi:hypothetical protein